jgi:hypothetical protein
MPRLPKDKNLVKLPKKKISKKKILLLAATLEKFQEECLKMEISNQKMKSIQSGEAKDLNKIIKIGHLIEKSPLKALSAFGKKIKI